MNSAKLAKIVMTSLLLLVASWVAGCAMPLTPRYTPSALNIINMKEMYGNSGHKIKAGNFIIEKEDLNCRLADINMPDNLTVAQYIRNGFSDELKMARLYSEKSSTEITAKILFIGVECNTWTAHWTTEMELKIGNGNPFLVKNTYDFEGSSMAAQVYRDAQKSLGDALQVIYGKIIIEPNFEAAFKD